MLSESNVPRWDEHSFSRNAYLMLTMLIQAIAFGVFLNSLPVFLNSLTFVQGQGPDRWPFLVAEFLTVVMVCFGHITVSRKLCWRLDLLDVLLPFLLGLFECLPMLVLGRVPNDAMWWFGCFFVLTNVSFATMMNARLKTSAAVALPLLKKRIILSLVHLYVLTVATALSFYQWHVQLLGLLFMVEQIGMFVLIYLFDQRTSMQFAVDVREGEDTPQTSARE